MADVDRFTTARFALILGLAVTACASRQPSSLWTADTVKNRKVILFIPGLYGTALAREADGARVFQTLGQGLWGKIPLALEGNELGIQGAVNLRADGVLDRVTIVPFLYSVDGYGGSVDYLSRVFGERTKIIAFSYDWRQDNIKAVRALAQQVRDLRGAGATSIALVGHSLGALIAAYYLRYGDQETEGATETWAGAQQVEAAVLAGAPFHGSMTAFHDFLKGTAVGFAKTPLAAESIGSFPSFYQFLPHADAATFVSKDFVPLGDSIYRVENWNTWKAGLFSNFETVDPVTREKRIEYTKRGLRTGRNFSALMIKPSSVCSSRPIPVLVGAGMGAKTLGRAMWTGTNWRFSDSSSKEQTLLEDGDGLVTSVSSSLPTAYHCLGVERAAFNMEHRGMFTRSDVQARVTAFLEKGGF